MEKIKLSIIFGGIGTEHDVSILSTKSIYRNINKEKYDISLIYISKTNKFENVEIINDEIKILGGIENIIKELKNQDVIFPVLHGKYGEDGTIQGLFEMIQKPYVGCKVLASSVGMDKVYSKILFEKANLKQAKYLYIKKLKNVQNDKFTLYDEEFNENERSIIEIGRIIDKKFKFPLFIKPANSGSSVGVSKVDNIEELESAIISASQFDKKILIEEGIIGREVECAVLGNETVISSCIGEVKAAEEFYSYDAKYSNSESKTIIPANISDELSDRIRNQAIKAYKIIDATGLSRVDFFIDENEEIYINEINTMPGFTNISMYPKLFENEGIEYSQLIDKLIELALE